MTRGALPERGQTDWLTLSGWRGQAVRGSMMLAASVLILGVLLLAVDEKAIVRSVETLPASAWLFGLLVALLCGFFTAVRWWMIVRALGHPLTFGRASKITLGVWPLSAISPGRAGELLKAYSLRKEVSPLIITGSVMVQRVLDMMMLAAMAVIGCAFLRNWTLLAASGVVLLLGAGAFQFARSRSRWQHWRIAGKLEVLSLAFERVRSRPALLVVLLLFTAAQWLNAVLLVRILFSGLGVVVPLWFIAAVLPLAIFIGQLPITFGGLGTRDTAVVVLFGAYATAAQALTVALLYSFFGQWLLVFFGLPFMQSALHLRR